MGQADDAWTIIGQGEEFESAVSSDRCVEIGPPLLNHDVDSNSSYSSDDSNSHSSVKSAYMERHGELEERDSLVEEPYIMKQQLDQMMQDMCVQSQEHAALVSRLHAERAVLLADRDTRVTEIAVLRDHISALEEEKYALLKERDQALADRFTVTQELEVLRREHAAQEATWTIERDSNMKKLAQIQKELHNLYTERDYWQEKYTVSTQETCCKGHMLRVGMQSLQRRVELLIREAQQCQLHGQQECHVMFDMVMMDNVVGVPEGEMSPGDVQVSMEALEGALDDLEHVLYGLLSQCQSVPSSNPISPPATRNTHTPPRSSPDRAPMISLSNFEENDLVLFFPTPGGDYLAFNVNAPRHYLSEESKALIGEIHISIYPHIAMYLYINIYYSAVCVYLCGVGLVLWRAVDYADIYIATAMVSTRWYHT